MNTDKHSEITQKNIKSVADEKNVSTQFIDWGLTDYQEAWDRQEELLNKTVAIKTENRVNGTHLPTPNYLIFNEHPHVYTLGKSGHP